jgi:hypothetical protein
VIPPIQANSDRLTVACWLCAEIITPLPPMRVKEHASIVARAVFWRKTDPIRSSAPARAGDRRFWLSSALRAHTKAP